MSLISLKNHPVYKHKKRFIRRVEMVIKYGSILFAERENAKAFIEKVKVRANIDLTYKKYECGYLVTPAKALREKHISSK